MSGQFRAGDHSRGFAPPASATSDRTLQTKEIGATGKPPRAISRSSSHSATRRRRSSPSSSLACSAPTRNRCPAPSPPNSAPSTPPNSPRPKSRGGKSGDGRVGQPRTPSALRDGQTVRAPSTNPRAQSARSWSAVACHRFRPPDTPTNHLSVVPLFRSRPKAVAPLCSAVRTPRRWRARPRGGDKHRFITIRRPARIRHPSGQGAAGNAAPRCFRSGRATL